MKSLSLCGAAVLTLTLGGLAESGCASGSSAASADQLGERELTCASSAECPAGSHCSTEDGVCNPPPGCLPGQLCPAVCYGTCVADPVVCGPTVCAPGEVCCNASCGICTAPGGACVQIACDPPPPGACRNDSDCRTFADYCTGCNCRALSICEKDPVCPGAPTMCFINPCWNKEAFCDAGRCALRDLRATCPVENCGPRLGMPNYLCPDGKTVAGPTGRCLATADGTCGWEITSCPDPSVCK